MMTLLLALAGNGGITDIGLALSKGKPVRSLFMHVRLREISSIALAMINYWEFFRVSVFRYGAGADKVPVNLT